MNTTNFANLISAQAKKYGNKTALYSRFHQHAHWDKLSWIDLEKHVTSVAKAFVEIGIKPQQCVGQFSHNKPENFIVDFALYSNRAVVVPIYPTSSLSEVTHIIENAEIEVLFVGNADQYEIAKKAMADSKFLKKIIVFDSDVKPLDHDNAIYFSDFRKLGEDSHKQADVNSRQEQLTEKDLACVLYTSGTSGISKGVKISHENLNEAIRTNIARLPEISDTETSIAFLPLTHIFERMWSYLCLHKGVTIYINHLPQEIRQTLSDVQPNYICSVPRFWEKAYDLINQEMATFSAVKLAVFTWAIAIGQTYNFEYVRIARTPDWYLKLRYFIADKLIFSKIKNKLGFQKTKMLPVAGARLSDELLEFFRAMGIPIVYGYGLTETTATVSCFEEIGYKIGSVGSVLPEINVKIGPHSEILVKGKTVTPGYYKNPEADHEAFTKDGWFKTGDAGYFQGNHLILTDRIKDLYKTSNGKFIAPQKIEAVMTLDRYIEQIAVVGDDRNYITALIVPSMTEIVKYAKEQKIEFEEEYQLLQSEKIYDLIDQRIKLQQKDMVHYEHIRRFTLVPQTFSIETGELTNTLKMRRAVIMQKYKLLIDSMYN